MAPVMGTLLIGLVIFVGMIIFVGSQQQRAAARRARELAQQQQDAANRTSALMKEAEDRARARLDMISFKYSDETVRQRISEQKIWQGMSRNQLIDSWDEPDKCSKRVLKTKIKETLSYGERGWLSRVHLEGGAVVGWQQPG